MSVQACVGEPAVFVLCVCVCPESNTSVNVEEWKNVCVQARATNAIQSNRKKKEEEDDECCLL